MTQSQLDRWAINKLLPRANVLLYEVGKRPIDRLEIRWDLAGRTAGQALIPPRGTPIIRINPQLLDPRMATLADAKDTLAHELAHIVAQRLAPLERPHGPIWRTVAKNLGASGATSHQLPLQRARRRREFCYEVGKQEVWLGTTRHRRLQSGQVRYRLKQGGPWLEPSQFTGRWRWQ